ncbi:hypothetical protein SAMN05216410_1999 [Sanguibacter gelidistatuariae]|uniref:Uncharacterized protein n=1 Tax=Sanguibacter gelidistatuariae TaxID=1814289 RepID=A0A1G6MXK2_9MICO|nr:hypothetical protein [Sanguibacter gelidistatuariae]SDC60272.1 hypothetical protein SAMN05216410_1999 [Sanguibacter gelidistatuariae]
MTLQTKYAFTLPRGFVDPRGVLHREGVMRLATARDELEPLRDPSVDGPEDPRLTVVILARVVESLGDLELVTTNEIENLFAADLAFLQDFYGVINFGSQAEYEELLAAQREALAPPVPAAPVVAAPAVPGTPAAPAAATSPAAVDADDAAHERALPAVTSSVTYARRTVADETTSDAR